MRTFLTAIGAMIALLAAGSHAHGQKATEQYIPIGQSPGMSHKYTWIGEIAQADARARTLTIVEAAGKHTVQITDETRIWLDRSKLKQTNLSGTFADLQPGRRAEVSYQGPKPGQVAAWVKVEITQP